jgi:hypothetical protein
MNSKRLQSFCFAVLLICQASITTANDSNDTAVPYIRAEKLNNPQRIQILQSIRKILSGVEVESVPGNISRGGCMMVLSLSRLTKTSIVAGSIGKSFNECLEQTSRYIKDNATAKEIHDGRLKIDVAMRLGPKQFFAKSTGSRLDPSTQGVWLPKNKLMLLPEELLSRNLFQDGMLQIDLLMKYLTEAKHVNAETVLLEEVNYYPIQFDSFVEGTNGALVKLFRGNEDPPSISLESLLKASMNGGEYLLKHQHTDGIFDYNYDARTNKTDWDYNLLRHAGTCYSLLELYQATGDIRFLESARIGIHALLRYASVPLDEHKHIDFETIVSERTEAKLGGAALAVLALAQYQLITHDSTWLPCARKLANFLLFQQKETGEFVSKYYYGIKESEPFESLYYPGESILALIRLYRVDPDPEWLLTAMRGADWLILTRDAGKKIRDLPHDHWLLIALNELEQITGKRLYTQHSFRIAQAILMEQCLHSRNHDWIGSFYDPPRSTPTATRAEGLVAVWYLARRTGSSNLLYLKALKRMASFQLRCQFTDENCIYLPRPDLAMGGFRRGLTDWEVRIDYVQHNISSLLGLYAILAALQN